MKTLLIMRHGKSDWKNDALPDIKRPLKARGEKDSAAAGRLLKESKFLPELIITSTAVRAEATAKLLSKAAGYTGNISMAEEIYTGGIGELAATIRKIPDKCARAMIIAHNPGLEDLVAELTAIPPASIKLPTGAIACLEIPIEEWEDSFKDNCVLKWLAIPDLYRTILQL